MKSNFSLLVIPILAITVFSSCLYKGIKGDQTLQEEEVLLKKYIMDIKDKYDVDTTSLGVFYYVREVGGYENIYPEFGDTLTLNYDGYLIDGTPFYSTSILDEKERTIIFGEEDDAIEGWIDGLKVIKKGSIVELIIPSPLGFGSKWNGNIPPNNTLIFVVKMVNIKKKNN